MGASMPMLSLRVSAGQIEYTLTTGDTREGLLWVDPAVAIMCWCLCPANSHSVANGSTCVFSLMRRW